MKKIIMLISTLIFGWLTTAQQVRLPIGNRTELMADAFGRVHWASISIGASTQSQNSLGYIRKNVRAGAIPVLDFFHSARSELNFKIYDREQPVFVYHNVYSENGDNLFSGWHQTKVIFREGKFVLSKTDFDLELNPRTKLKFDGVEYVRVYYTDENGDKQSERLDVEDGAFEFPSALAGKVDLLVVEAYDVEDTFYEYAFNRQGIQVDPYNIDTTTITTTIRDVQIFVDTDVVTVIPAQGGVGRNPYFELQLSAKKDVNFDVQTSEEARPEYLVYKRGDEWYWFDLKQGTKFTLEKGNHQFYFRWDPKKFQDEEERYWPPDEDNWKGSVDR